MGRQHRNPTSKGCWRDHPCLHGHHLVQNVLRLHWTDPTARTAPRWCPGPMRAEGKDGLMTLWASVELETSARNGSWTVEPSSERKLTMHGVQNALSEAAHLRLCATCVVLSCNQPGMTLWVRPRLHQLLESWQTKGHEVSLMRSCVGFTSRFCEVHCFAIWLPLAPVPFPPVEVHWQQEVPDKRWVGSGLFDWSVGLCYWKDLR